MGWPFLEDRDHASVYYPVGTEWVSAEPVQADVAAVTSMCRKALELF